jgi:hypothetical protein
MFANLCYCAAYLADIPMQFLSFQDTWRRRRCMLWFAGMLFAFVVTNYWIVDEIYPFVQRFAQRTMERTAMKPTWFKSWGWFLPAGRLARLARAHSNDSFLPASFLRGRPAFALRVRHALRHFSILGFGVDHSRLDCLAHFTQSQPLISAQFRHRENHT